MTVSPAVLLMSVLAIIASHVAIAFWLLAALRTGSGRTSPAEPAAGRRLDDDRAYQAVASEVAKRQVAVLSEASDAVQQFERACFEHARRLCELLIAEWKRAGAVGLPDSLPNDLNAAMRFFVMAAERPLDEVAQHRIRKDLEANVTVLQNYCESTTSMLESNIFWLGSTLEAEFRRYVSGLGAVFTQATAHPRDLKSSSEKFRALMDTHPDASRAIEQLVAGAARGSSNRPARIG